jgi:hypothetical protein
VLTRNLLLISAVVVGAVGCAAPQPVAENFPLSYQKVARTAKHWDIVADDVVSQTSTVLATTQQLQGRGVFVLPTERNTAFDATLRDFLINRMVDRGVPVSVCSTAGGTGMVTSPDVNVRYETRILGHADISHYRPGLLTALAGGIFVGRSIAESDVHPDTVGVAAFGLLALADLAQGHIAKPTHTELVITTTVAENNRYLMRRSDIYYVPDGDINLFTRRVAGSPACGPRPAVAARDMVDDEQARADLVARGMRRSNPQWRPTIYGAAN